MLSYILIGSLISLFIVFVLYSKRLRNEFKLIFLFGKKGSGKSTLLVRYMTEYHKKGYSVYTNMQSVSLPYVVHIDPNQLGEFVAKPKSLICLDECGILYDNRKFKVFKDDTRDYFVYQRQYKNVVIYTSQSWNVDKKIKDLTDQLYLCGRIGAISFARPIDRHITLTAPMGDSESRIADQLRFRPFSAKLTWIPRYSKYFDSFAPPERPFFIDPPDIPVEKKTIRSAVRRLSADFSLRKNQILAQARIRRKGRARRSRVW